MNDCQKIVTRSVHFFEIFLCGAPASNNGMNLKTLPTCSSNPMTFDEAKLEPYMRSLGALIFDSHHLSETARCILPCARTVT